MITTILRKFRKKGHNLKHILLVGYGRSAEGYIDRICAHPEWGYVVHGILDDRKQNGKSYRDVHVIGDIDDLESVIANNSYDEIAITLGIDQYGRIFCIAVFSLPMLIVAIIVKMTSEGPLIFKQERIGLHGKPFIMYKFRSMEVQKASEEKKAWTTQDDPRVTPIGKFIRKTSLDELPQFFNVLRGQMSLVGPRPERPFFVDKFKEEIPRYMIKHQVRPGITGWAQVNGYRGDSSIRLRIDCDLYYIENWTVMLDIKILLLTLVRGFINKNAY